MMIKVIFRILIILNFISISISGFSQNVKGGHGLPRPIIDSLIKRGYRFSEQQRDDTVDLTTSQALRFLQQRLRLQYWKDPADPLRTAIGQLVFEAGHKPYDTAEVYLSKYPFDSLNVKWDKFYIWEPLNLSIPSAGIKDTSILVVIDTLHEVTSDYPEFPFTYYEHPYQSDSIRAAVSLLRDYVEARDSSIIYFTGTGNEITPVWLNSRSGMMKRYWLKTDLYDSVIVWIGIQSRNTIALYLENGVSFLRPAKQQFYTDAKVDVREIDRSKLQDVKKITIKPQYWKYRSEAAFALNQAYIENWVKGGESNVSTSLDITGYADYSNKPLKITSNNFARLKYGLIWTKDDGIRKNLDLLETNSKLNHKAFGKFDFSAILLFKTQIAGGFTYANDGSKKLVSKFMSPGVITAGLGLDYKPNKTTSINFSPVSYKGTFVLDTTGTKGVNAVDQTKYGIAPDRKWKNEPGVSFMITNEYKPLKTLAITNRLQLFTNYIDNPQNIDIDWEMILTANLNWFTDVRFNTHLIFDDDTKSPVNPDDSNSKKTARVQFKELLGFSFIFRF
ncbi:MAG: DUF3078 domain-containing protein [Bacteroidia bacterium]|nr:DUF3078 domain-containing protein [Bacteroidia bacterium]